VGLALVLLLLSARDDVLVVVTTVADELLLVHVDDARADVVQEVLRGGAREKRGEGGEEGRRGKVKSY